MVVDSLEEVFSICSKHKKEGKVIGFTHGQFDLFHAGHLLFFNLCKEKCDILIVGVDNDRNVLKRRKKMPVIPEEERCFIVANIKSVDYAFILKEDLNRDYNERLYRRLDVDQIFIGRDYGYVNIKIPVESVNADLIVIDQKMWDRSTSQIIKDIKATS
jgi:cytidyltransferase-like protein